MESKGVGKASGAQIVEPESAHIRQSPRNDNSDDELEATELQNVSERRISRVLSPGNPPRHWYDPVRRIWRHHIRISVPHVDCRDHLANERTYLAYMRTSAALSMIGIAIAQLYRLQHSTDPSPVFGYYVLAKPIAALFQCSALGVTVIGACRFYRQQKAMTVGKIHAGGWELSLVTVLLFLLLLAMFVVHIGVDVYKDYHG